VLPLFQMIGKNVGIRRARGEFVLATNIDILFSDELFQFLATRSLKHGEMYRVDRWDVSPFISVEASLAEQLTFCRENCLRVNRKGETVIVEPVQLISETSEPAAVEPNEASEPIDSSHDNTVAAPPNPWLSNLRQLYRHLLPKRLKDAVLDQLPGDLRQWLIQHGLLSVQPLPPPVVPVETEPEPEPEPAIDVPRYPDLHLNGCGDFTLLPRETWLEVRGYPEFEMHGLHLDSILCHAAYHTGLREQLLEPNQVVYHIEHGRTWFPDWGSESAVSKEEIDRIPKLEFDQLQALAALMNQLHRPILFNDEDWGFGAIELAETIILPEQVLV
jgi:hypothetical protein